jgi:tRNA U34 2-thiouridine synthase MnmA/TrmU
MPPSEEKQKIKAVGLLSGGLDSTLAAKLMIEQGIDVYAINFTSPFCTCTPKKSGCSSVMTAVKKLGDIPLKLVAMKDEYLEIVRNPKHGHGSGMNPCLDCRIIKIKKAGVYMHEIGASFLFTGEVLDQRPMSQHRRSIDIIDRESGFKGYILRPLSAQHFEPTIPEQKGFVDRTKLLAIAGRSRKIQMSLAAEKGITDYPCPAGGCLLTDKYFAGRLRDYFKYTETPSMRDIKFLKIGRHFRTENGDKIIVARNESECIALKKLSDKNDHLFEPSDFPGPTVVLKGNSIEKAFEKLLYYTKHGLSENSAIIHSHGGKKEILKVSLDSKKTPEKSCCERE